MMMIKSIKKFTVVVVLSATVLSIAGFTDHYFEISKNLDIFATLYKELNIYYVDDTKPGELMKTGIDAMLKSLDPYTNYIPESQIEDYRFMTTGQYGGIGALIRKIDDFIVIAEPYEGFPAHKAGLKAGDRIIEVNGQSTKGKNTSEMSKILKGQPGTQIQVKVKRYNVEEVFERSITRQEVKIEDVPYFGVVGDSTGYIKLTGFTETASKEVKDAYKKLKTENQVKSLILDLRDNGGGLLREAVNIVNMFVEKGQVIVNTKGRIKDWDRNHKAINTPDDLKIPLVILINENSASASEIVSGAIQDLDRGVIVGRKSYGKGLVQQTRNLSYNSKLKVTVAKYYIPSERCIQKLDYSNRKSDGSVEAVPDSLISNFKTKAGRMVKDGAGITPDISVKLPVFSAITGTLVSNNLVFDYSTEYYYSHDTIQKARKFDISTDQYENFKKWLDNKDYEYTTESETYLEELKEVIESEKYFEEAKTEYEALKNRIHANKKEDLMTFNYEIKLVLRSEIVSRYFFQRGRIENSLENDPDISAALDVLNNKVNYKAVLAGTFPKGNIRLPQIAKN